jgi:hypothetical protein
MEFYLLFAIKYIRSFFKFLIFTAILFLAKKFIKIFYKFLRKIFRSIIRKIKKIYFGRKFNRKSLETDTKYQ